MLMSPKHKSPRNWRIQKVLRPIFTGRMVRKHQKVGLVLALSPSMENPLGLLAGKVFA